MKKLLATTIIASTLAIATYGAGVLAQNGFRISGSIIHQKNDKAEVTDARLFTVTNDVITAKSAVFALENNDLKSPGAPYVVELNGLVGATIGDSKLLAPNGARYYPELNALVSDKLIVSTPSKNALLGATYSCTASNQVQITYSNGMTATAGRACEGSTEITCKNGQIVRKKNASSCA
jgi:hypothetical protein